MYPGKAAWFFVNVPEKTSEEIEFYFAHEKRGWGSLPVHVTIGETTWKTSIFTDKKTATFLLPIKSEVRKKEEIKEGDVIQVTVEVIH
jgi:hypothetical protein